MLEIQLPDKKKLINIITRIEHTSIHSLRRTEKWQIFRNAMVQSKDNNLFLKQSMTFNNSCLTNAFYPSKECWWGQISNIPFTQSSISLKITLPKIGCSVSTGNVFKLNIKIWAKWKDKASEITACKKSRGKL